MAKSDEKEPNFDDLELPEEQPENDLQDLLGEPAAFEEFAEPGSFSGIEELGDLSAAEVAPEETVEEAIVDEAIVEPLESHEVLADVEEVHEVEPLAQLEPSPSKLPFILEIVGVAAIPLLLVVAAVLHFIYLPTAVWLIGLGFIPYGLWKAKETNAYMIFLGCALAAMLTAIYVFWIELATYNYEVKAKHRVASVETQPAYGHKTIG